MALFVANLTKHNFQLHFWVERTQRPIFVEIPPGQQKSIYPEGTRLEHENIVNQHKMYGLIPVSEMDLKKGFVGQCYQFDKPIPLDRLQSTMLNNEDELYDEALERRKEAAAASDHLIRKAAQETDSKIASFEVEIEEVEQKGVESQVHEVITVGEDAPQESRRRGRPRRN
ncbi:hypothetical protein WM24_23815 [Burkholderia ubonensis]|uniref:hypothetical protein n=1 Tax=Burkholderia ubonensis TaxID=101571 RepID=UPI00075F0F29|nr:hypothetical protein [Burkholderia ubonensis]KWN80864.1 hypothetical protein WM24_23815 [Burkholderia ubonensis]